MAWIVTAGVICNTLLVRAGMLDGTPHSAITRHGRPRGRRKVHADRLHGLHLNSALNPGQPPVHLRRTSGRNLFRPPRFERAQVSR
jgi:hypothetical protein